MIKQIGHILLLLSIFSCYKEGGSSATPTLSLSLELEENNTSVSNPVTVSIQVENADSLFALSFEFNYSTQFFNTEPITIESGNLFIKTNKYEYLADGEVSIVVAENDKNNVRLSTSGTACHITLIPKNSGSTIFYLSSLHMIKTDGSSIDGFDVLGVESIDLNISE